MRVSLARQHVLFGPALLATSSLLSSAYGQADSNATTCSFLGLFPLNNVDPSLANYSAPGISLVAAMRLAVDHLQNRDDSVVPNLSVLLDDCTLQFGDLYYFDTPSDYYLTLEAILRRSESVPDLCGVVGPYDYKAQVESSILAGVLDLPQLLFAGGDTEHLTGTDAKVTVGNFIGFDNYFDILVDYWVNVLGVEYMALVSADTAKDEAMARAFTHAIDKAGKISARLFGFEPNTMDKTLPYQKYLKDLKDSGYRNIFLSPDGTDASVILELAQYLEDMDMLNGDYFYIFSEESIRSYDLEAVFGRPKKDSAIAKLLNGAAWFAEVDPFLLNETDRFLTAWRGVDGTRLAGPLPGEAATGVFLDESYFSTQTPFRHSSFVYDSVVALGLGHCRALKAGGAEVDDTGMDEENKATVGIINNVVRNIVENLPFQGASGQVDFQLKDAEKYRASAGVTVALFNFRAVESDDGLASFESVIIGHRRPGAAWETEESAQFMFADSSYSAPEQYVYSDMHYLSNPVQTFGLALFGIGCTLALLCGGSVAYLQADALMMVAQPFFLKIVCIGSFIENFTIFSMSFDESTGWSHAALDAACVATPWLFFIGHATIYSAIFCKLWRVDRVMQARRQKVTHFQVMWPVFFLFAAIVIVLSVWTARDPLQWERSALESSSPPESKGGCQSEHFNAYFWTCAALIGVPTLVTIIAVWRTTDISQDLSDTSVIFYLIVAQFQAWLLGIPVLAVLGDSSTDAAYVGRVLLVWIFAMAPLLIVLTPTIYRAVAFRLWPDSTKKLRGNVTRTGNIRISVLAAPLEPVNGSGATECGSGGDKRNDLSQQSNTSTECTFDKPARHVQSGIAESKGPIESDVGDRSQSESTARGREEADAFICASDTQSQQLIAI